jgi:type IV secretory pathway component VirB8
MKSREITLAGNTDSNAKLRFWNKAQFDEFMKQWPNSNFQILVKVQPSNTSEALVAYYRDYILVEFQRAFREYVGQRMTIEGTENELKSLTVSMQSTPMEQEGYGEYFPVEEAGNQRMTDYIEELRELGAGTFGINIQDPKKI